MLAVDEDQVLADLRALAGFGKLDTGVNRPAFTDADLAAREWLRRRMQAAGLEAVIDGVGNVYGQAPGADRTVLLGSHPDTVPDGGWLDGALGVIFGLEVVRAWRRARRVLQPWSFPVPTLLPPVRRGVAASSASPGLGAPSRFSR